MTDEPAEQLRAYLLEAAEARDDGRLEDCEDALLQALSDVRRDQQVRMADGGESA